jgi:hypothetical protein
MVNYGAPNSENLDDFMRLDASLVTVSISPQPLKQPYAVESSISLMKTMSSTAITKSTQAKNNTVTVNNKSLGMTPNVSFRVNFNLK